MADLSKIKLNGTEYNLKDAEARNIKIFNLTYVSTSSNIIAFTCDDGYTNFNSAFNSNKIVYIKYTVESEIFIFRVEKLIYSNAEFGNWTGDIYALNIASYNIGLDGETQISKGVFGINSSGICFILFYTKNLMTAYISSSASPQDYSSVYNDVTYELMVANIASKENLPLIVTGTCNFATSLGNGTDTVLSITNVSHTVAQIATAVTANRLIYFVLTNNDMKIMLQYSVFDGSAYYFTNAYDPFTQTQYDNESFNITVKAYISDGTDIFTYMITYNKNVFAKKSEVQTQINETIGGITEFDTQVVQSLPQTGVEGTIYFTPNNHGTNDIYDEFIYVNNAWEKIGNTQVDLSGYARTDQLANVAITGSYNNLVDTPDIPTKTSDLTNDSNFITLNDVPVELPAVTSADNNKVLTVDNGAWSAKTPAASFSGSYNDLSDKPTLFSGNYNDLTNKPTLFSGSYNDLSDKPTIPSATVVTQTITSGVKIAEINGTAIYAPAYANGDQIAY